jgi:hypothetical protein
MNRTATIDRKGVLSFLLLTFGITFAYEGCLIGSGINNMNFGLAPHGPIPPVYVAALVGLAMWIPTISTVIVVKFVTKEGFGITNLRLGTLRPYAVSALVIPAGFAAIYTLTWLAGLATPDWQLRTLRSITAARGFDTSNIPDSYILLPGVFFASLALGPIINGIFGFGEEFGWRGYLLPKLMPLGKWKAYLLVGVIWGFWHGPLILVGFNYPGYPILGVFAMIGLTTTSGFYINEMTVRHRSSILAGWIHGAFNGQFYGVWRILFPNVHPLLGGVTGLIGMMVWATLGLAVVRKAEVRPDRESGTPVEPVAPPNAASPHRDKGRFWNP